MKKHFTLLLGIFFLQITISQTTTKTVIQEKLDSIVSTNKLPGINFSVVLKNGKTQSFSAGYADTEEKIKLTPSHTFFSGSIGKTYAATLVFQLMEKGKINFKDKFISYFPEVNWLQQLPNIQDITIEMLLQHTSGLPRYVFNVKIWEVLHEQPDKVWTYKDRLSYIFNAKPVHEAGKAWAYSDTNYILLGMLIEKVTGKEYYNLVTEHILKKMQLKETHPSLRRDIPNLAAGYSQMPAAFKIPTKTVTNGKYVFNPQMEWTGGGMASTTTDLAKWAKYYYEATLFSDETLQLVTTVNPNGQEAEGSSYGTGSFIFNTKFGKAYGHSGFMPGFTSIFIYYPEHKLAAALQINCDYAQFNLNDCLDELIAAGNQ